MAISVGFGDKVPLYKFVMNSNWKYFMSGMNSTNFQTEKDHGKHLKCVFRKPFSPGKFFVLLIIATTIEYLYFKKWQQIAFKRNKNNSDRAC